MGVFVTRKNSNRKIPIYYIPLTLKEISKKKNAEIFVQKVIGFEYQNFYLMIQN